MIEIASSASEAPANASFAQPAGVKAFQPFSDSAMSRLSFGRRARAAMSYSLIAAYADLTGWTDKQTANMLGIARSTVQAVRTGKLAENLTVAQRDLLIRAAQSYRQEVYETVAKMELYS